MGCHKSTCILSITQIYTINIMTHFKDEIVKFALFATKTGRGANFNFLWHKRWPFRPRNTTQTFTNTNSTNWRWPIYILLQLRLHGNPQICNIWRRFLLYLLIQPKYTLSMTGNVINSIKLTLHITDRLLHSFKCMKTFHFSSNFTLFQSIGLEICKILCLLTL